MRVIAVSTLKAFWVLNPQSEQPLKAWFHEARASNWQNPTDIKSVYRSASILQAGRVVFNISGNRFRLVVQIAFKTQIVFVKFVGTHAEYDQINAQTIELGAKN